MESEAHDDDEDFPDPTLERVRELLREMLSEATSGKPTPIILPAGIIEELHSYCQEHAIPKDKVIPLAMNDCKKRQDEFVSLLGE
jgi:hypothetical protein